jgi:hypothetical protein
MKFQRINPFATLGPCGGAFGLAALFSILLNGVEIGWAQEPSNPIIKTERFDKDPGWEAYKNRIVPEAMPVIKQDFGYSETNFAGGQKGEMGGRVQRSTVPALYVDKIAPKTLDDKLWASGTFAVTSIQGGSGGMLFGFLNSQALPGNGDTSSLTMLLIFEKEGGRISVRLHNRLNQSCGTFITPYIPGRYRPTPIRPDGTRYHWTINYDPQGNKGSGQIQITVKSSGSTRPPEDFEGLLYTVNLPPGFKKEGATFDCFGLTNARKTGGGVQIYFDDLEYAGKREDFSKPSATWQGSGNRAEGKEALQAGAHDFGHSAKTNFAGGEAGEAGGAFWRTESNFGTYADRIGPLTLEDRIEAGGKVVLQAGALDSDMALGFFNSASRDKSPTAANFLGILVGGPTRRGHMFSPSLSIANGDKSKVPSGPVLMPGKPYEWTMLYDPTANNGKGSVQVTLGEGKVTLDLKPGEKANGATFDRFGLMSVPPGGNLVRVYVDDLKYTAGRTAPSR